MVGHKLENFHQLDLLEVTLEQKMVKKNSNTRKEKQQMKEA
jgi:hypothetical protein